MLRFLRSLAAKAANAKWHRMSFPPSKRLRGPAPVLDLDPFGDEDFTQDDLAEIDVFASQAVTAATGGGAELGEVSRATGLSRHTGLTAALGSDRTLEAQHSQLKRKLEQVEEDIVLKSGEIRVLRDSLRAAQQDAETHRLKQVQVQTQIQKEQSHREKELLKKVQSLESELQFKEAEIHDMKSRLLTDRRSSPLCRSSPRPQSSASPSGGFITKETFVAQVNTTPVPSGRGSTVTTPSKARRQEATPTDPFLSIRAERKPRPGGVLLGILLQPLSQRISLCHLLSLSSKSSLVGGGDVISVIGNAVSPLQSLALTGLNMISLSRDHSSCPGAVLLLPLLNSHLVRLCSAADTSLPSCTSAAPRGPRVETEELSLEECGLVALRTLTTLLQHSPEVVEAVLSDQDSDSQDYISHNAVLPCVLRLCKASQTDLTCAALTSLTVLLQRTPHSLQDRGLCVLDELVSCLSSERRVKVVTSCVSALIAATDHQDLMPRLYRHDPCVVLRLLLVVRSRSDSEALLSDWLQLDLKVVRLVSRLRTQSSATFNPNCPCHSELVQCMVLILHRLWLELRAEAPPTSSEAPPPNRNDRGRVLTSLQETVLLFHWLLQNHSGFTESCRGVLHLYDQVIPALRESLPQTGYSQELALEEIFRSEPDDDMETDSGS